MKKRLFCYLAFSVLVAFGLIAIFPGGVVAEGKQYVMRIGTPTTKDPQVFEMEQFKKLVEAKVGDKIKVELYPSGQLGSNSQMLQGVSAGSIQGLLEPTSFLSGFDNVMNVVDLPYTFPDVWSTAKLFNGPVGDALRDHLAERGLVAASFYPYGERVMLVKFPVNKMDDFKGKKIRVMGSKMLQDQINAFGAAGVPMDVPQLYTALQQGVIDGIESTPPFFWTLRYYELAKYLFTEPDACVVTVFMMNKKWLDTLPADLRAAVLKSAEEVQPMAENFTRGAKGKSYDVMQKNGVKVINASPELKAQMKEACGPVIEKFLDENPEAKPVYNRLKKAMAK
ncbi:MAG: TRAP transporter substrate-binding protein [Deltaproteobacteria bacterium]|nr:MAG: TRAP transporter substrate-binding protein [Deltaproteobacteria bacterium]